MPAPVSPFLPRAVELRFQRDTSKQRYVCIGMDLSGPLAFVSEKSGLHLDSLHAEFGRAGAHSTATQPKAIKKGLARQPKHRPPSAAQQQQRKEAAHHHGCLLR